MTTTSVGIRLAVDGASQVQEDLRRVTHGVQGLSDSLSRMGHGGAAILAGQQIAQSMRTMGAAIFESTIAADRLRTSLQFSTGNSAGEMAYLREMTNRLGLEFTSTAQAFSGFAAAAKGTSLEGAGARAVFDSISKAASVMGLSTDQAKGSMLAVQQMMSKGIVSAEEFRQQLGERMPMALQAAANATGTTTAEFSKLLESGKVIAEDFLPKFAKSLDSMLGDASASSADRLDASVVRMENAFERLKENIGKAGVAQAMSDRAKAATNDLDAISTAMENAARSGKGFWGQLNDAAAVGIVRGTFGLVQGAANLTNSTLNSLSGGVLKLNDSLSLIPTAAKPAARQVVDLDDKLKAAWKEFDTLQQQFARAPSDIYLKSAVAQLSAQINAMQTARNQMASIAGKPTEATGSVPNPDRLLLEATAKVDAAALAAAQKEGKAYADLMGKMATDKEKFTAAVFDAKAALGSLYSPEIEARLREHYIKPEKDGAKAHAEASESAKLYGHTMKKLVDLSIDSESATAGYTKTQKELLEVFASPGFADMPDAWKETVVAQAEANITAEQLAVSNKALAAIETDLAKTELARIDAAEKSAASAAQKVQALLDEEKALAIAAAQNISLAQALQDVAMARLKEQQAALMREGDRDSEVLAIQSEIDALRRLRDALGRKEGREAATKAADDAKKAWERTADQIENSLTDALMRGFEGGKGFAENLRDTVVNMFKTMVLRPVVQATVQGGLNAVGLGSPGGQGGGNLLGTASNLYSAFGSGSGAAAGTLAASNLVGAAGGDALGTLIAGNASNWGVSAAGVTGSASAVGSIAAAAPYLAAVMAVVSLAKSLDDSGTLHTGGLGSYSAAGGAAVGDAVKGQGLSFNLSNESYQASTQQANVQLAQSIVGLLDSTATTFGKEAGYWAATGFADDTSKDGAWGALAIKMGDTLLADWKNGADKWPGREFADGEAGAREYAAAVALDVRNLLLEQTPEWADTMLRALGDAPGIEQLAATVGQINAAASALDAMGRASQAFATLGETAAGALITALGGAEAAVAGLSGYYGNFYTETERAGIATAQLTKQLGELGVAMPISRDAFRALVDEALAAGKPALAAALVNLSDEFAALVPAAEAAGQAVAAAAEAQAAAAVKAEQDAAQEAAQQAASALETAMGAANAAIDAANAKSKAFFDQFSSTVQDAASTLGGASRNIRQFLEGLTAQAGGALGYTSAAVAFSSQLTLAQGGDRDALGGITSYASTLIDAIRRESASAAEANTRIGRVRGQLAGLPGQVNAEQLIVNAIDRQTLALANNLTGNFQRLDGNLDGLLTFDELKTAGLATDGQIGNVIAALDTNADGQVSAIEAMTGTLAARFDAIDVDISGAINYAEFSKNFAGLGSESTLRSIFSELDTNGDGQISRLESIRNSSGETATNTYGLDKLTRIGDVVNSLQWGTTEWDAASTKALATVAGQQGWTASDIATAIGRFTGQEIADFFAKYGSSITVGGLGSGAGASTASTGSTALTSASKPGFGGFAVGGSTPSSTGSYTVTNGVGTLSQYGNTYYGSLGTAINDAATVGRLDSINGYINTLDWSASSAGASAAALAAAAAQYGVTAREIAIATGYTEADILALNPNIPRYASGGMHPGGLRLVGENGPELEVTGPARIFNATETASLLQSGGASGGELLAELRALRVSNEAQRADAPAQARALVGMQQRMLKLQERWDANGLPQPRVEA